MRRDFLYFLVLVSLFLLLQIYVIVSHSGDEKVVLDIEPSQPNFVLSPSPSLHPKISLSYPALSPSPSYQPPSVNPTALLISERPELPKSSQEKQAIALQWHWPLGSRNNRTTPLTCKVNEQLPPNRLGCKLVSFWGGGKAGSTTLAIRLKHNASNPEVYDPEGPFVDGGKEICWVARSLMKLTFWETFFPQCSRDNPVEGRVHFALDGCPRYFTRQHAQRLACADPDMKLIWLVRDPVERLISEINDSSSRRAVSKTKPLTQDLVDTYVVDRRWVPASLSSYHIMYDIITEYFPPSQVLLVVSEYQTFDNLEDAKISMDFIMDFLGGPHRAPILTSANNRSKTETYLRPSAVAMEKALNLWKEPMEQFYEKLGKRIPFVNFP